MTLKIDGKWPLTQFFDMKTSVAFYRDFHSFEIVESRPIVAWDAMKQLYVLDPDGYKLRFQWPTEK